MVSRKPPRSNARTCSPSSVNSLARMLAVQPNPTRTTSTRGSRVAMSCSPHGSVAAGDAHERHVVALAELIDFRDIVVARTWKADQLPADEFAVSAVNRIGEKALDGVLDEDVEECRRRSARELELALLARGEHRILRCRVELGERLVAVIASLDLVDLANRG